MKNYIGPGKSMTVTAGGAIVAGNAYIVGSFVGVASTSAANTEQYELCLEGVFELPKKANLEIVQGDKVWWDATPGEVTKTAADGTYCGIAVATAAGAATTVKVRLSSAEGPTGETGATGPQGPQGEPGGG